MIAIDISYEGRNIKLEGGQKLSVAVESDIVDVLRGQLISVARQVLKEQQSKGEFPKQDYITLVDGKLNSNESSVKAFGTIEYQTKLETLKPVLLLAMQKIVERSPEKTGAYLANHVLFKNNTFVAKGFSNIISFVNSEDDFKPGDIYRFVNMSPYARKLERNRTTKQTQGRGKGKNITKGKKERIIKGQVTIAPSGAYVLATRSLKRKFKSLKNNIRFSFIPISPGVARQLDTSGKDTTGYVFAKGRADGNGAGRPYLYPSLTVTASKESVTFNRGFTERGSLWVQKI